MIIIFSVYILSIVDLGDCRSAENAAKTNLQSNVSLSQSATVEDQAHFKLGFDQPLVRETRFSDNVTYLHSCA